MEPASKMRTSRLLPSVMLLITLITLITMMASAAQAGAPTRELLARGLEAGTQLEESLRSLLRRAKYPGTPGTGATVPSRTELGAAEARFLEWKSGLEQILGDPMESRALSPEATVRLINSYFNRLTLLTTLRISTQAPHGLDWSERFALEVPRSLLAELPGLSMIARDRSGEAYQPVIVDFTNEQRGRLRMSASLIQGLELGTMAEKPGSDGYLTLIQYLSVRQLLQNLSDLRGLLADHAVPAEASIPSSLRAKLESLGAQARILEEHRKLSLEPAARAALIQAFKEIRAQLPAFASPKLSQELSRIIGREEAQRRQLVRPLQEALTLAENESLEAALEQEIQGSSLPLARLTQSETQKALRSLLSNAQANTQLSKLLGLVTDGLLELDSDQRSRILNSLDQRKQELAIALPEPALARWQARARESLEREVFADRRARFVRRLLAESQRIAYRSRRITRGSDAPPALLIRSIRTELAGLSPRESLNQWLLEIGAEPDYPAARKKYRTLLAEAEQSRVPEMKFSRGVAPDLAERLQERVQEGRRKDLRDLRAVGAWLAFDREFNSPPNASEILGGLSSTRFRKYLKEFDHEILARFPILSVSVEGRPLFENLGELGGVAALWSDKTRARAERLIDQALTTIEAGIQEQIRKVANAVSVEEIRTVADSSVVLSLVLSGYPEFQLIQERSLYDAFRRPLLDQVMTKYVGRYLGYGFGTLMLLQGTRFLVKRSSPFVDVVLSAISPLMTGYLRSALALIVVDSIHQGAQVYDARRKSQEATRLFESTADGQPLLAEEDYRAANSSYQLTQWMFIGRVAMDAAFMYYPMAKQALGLSAEAAASAERIDGQIRSVLGLTRRSSLPGGVAP